MPTQAVIPGAKIFLHPDENQSWTEALAVCKESGIGLSTNLLYREDGHRQEEHEFEDQSFHVKTDSVSMYGVFDGHEGVHVAKQALETITAEVLLDQELMNKTKDDDIKQLLKHAFNVVESNYLQAIGDKLAEKASLQMQIPSNLTPYEVYQKYPFIAEKLNTINTDLSCGTTAVVALIHSGRLYVANVGDSRALLCKTDSNGVLRVMQLTQDHILSNEDEILRLSMLKIPLEKIRRGFRLGNHITTRCLGNYLIKAEYKEFEELKFATSEPVIAVPEIIGGILLDKSCRFLLLMSSGLYRSLEEATGTKTVNQEITRMVVEQFKEQSTLTGVVQAVVDKIVRIHHDFYMSRSGSDKVAISKHEDITLLIRNFNFPLPNAISSISYSTELLKNSDEQNVSFESDSTISSDKATARSSLVNSVYSNDTTSAELLPNHNGKSRHSDRIKPYVDFQSYYQNVEKAKLEGSLPEGIKWDYTVNIT